MKGEPMKIHRSEDAASIRPTRIMTARQIPLKFQDAAFETTQKLIKDGIIKKIDESEGPSEWVSAGFFVPKKNGVRLVTDFVQVNKTIRRPVQPFPSTQEILRALPSKAKVFIVVDAVQGYHQIPLDEESSKLTTFLLPWGRHRYLRAPMGLAPSSDEWLVRSDQAIHGIPNTMKLVDDIITSGATYKEALENFSTILKRCEDMGITLSLKKLQAGKSVNFAGHIVDTQGVRPEKEKLEAIRCFPTPKNVTDLRSFLGLANQLGPFLPDMTHLSAALRPLLKKDVVWQWLADHDAAFQKMREILTSDMMVSHYDPELPTELLTDASRLYGIGYALLQKKPDGKRTLIRCGSRSLTSAETRYAVIELECMGIAWGVEQCRYYLAGNKFHVVTDHRPLIGIFKKGMNEITNARILRYREQLSPYVFTIEWTEGKTHLIADALSRSPVFQPPEEESDADAVEYVFRAWHAEDEESTLTFEEMIEAATKDHDYQKSIALLRLYKGYNRNPDGWKKAKYSTNTL